MPESARVKSLHRTGNGNGRQRRSPKCLTVNTPESRTRFKSNGDKIVAILETPRANEGHRRRNANGRHRRHVKGTVWDVRQSRGPPSTATDERPSQRGKHSGARVSTEAGMQNDSGPVSDLDLVGCEITQTQITLRGRASELH
jgi:hypothetical protein